jgi:hypothetical protein
MCGIFWEVATPDINNEDTYERLCIRRKVLGIQFNLSVHMFMNFQSLVRGRHHSKCADMKLVVLQCDYNLLLNYITILVAYNVCWY